MEKVHHGLNKSTISWVMRQYKKDFIDISININGKIQPYQTLLNAFSGHMITLETHQWVKISISLTGVKLG